MKQSFRKNDNNDLTAVMRQQHYSSENKELIYNNGSIGKKN
ncbi:hypothetical protein [Colwellia psychrerythraea]|nr:hypothetical protein [Colwellia psychrerythraea]